MVLPRQGTTLLIVDVQERLFPAMDADHREEVMRNIKILVTTARRLGLPVVATEQYPKGLGHTLPELRDTLGPEVQPVRKVNGAEVRRLLLLGGGGGAGASQGDGAPALRHPAEPAATDSGLIALGPDPTGAGLGPRRGRPAYWSPRPTHRPPRRASAS